MISRSERNFAGATLSGIYLDRDRHRCCDFDGGAFDGGAQFKRGSGGQKIARLAG